MADADRLTLAEFKEKWRGSLGDEHTGEKSRKRYKKMKERHDAAKNQIFLAAASHGLVPRLERHIKESAEDAEYKRTSPEEAASIRERIARLLDQDKEDRHRRSLANPHILWKMPQQDASTPTEHPAQSYTSGSVTLKGNQEAPPLKPWY